MPTKSARNLLKTLLVIIMTMNAFLINSLSIAKPITKQDQHIIEVIKGYLLENPEFLIEVQRKLEQKQETQRKKEQKDAIAASFKEIYDKKGDVILGDPLAKKTLVVFFDYNCGYCKKSLAYFPQLLARNQNLRIILKDLPILSLDSLKAHTVAQAFYTLMPQNFMNFLSKMVTHKGTVGEQQAIEFALSFGVDKKALLQEMKNPNITQKLLENEKLAYTLQISGTPAYIINNEVVSGALDPETLQAKLKAM